jgi:hypothetical protein
MMATCVKDLGECDRSKVCGVEMGYASKIEEPIVIYPVLEE